MKETTTTMMGLCLMLGRAVHAAQAQSSKISADKNANQAI